MRRDQCRFCTSRVCNHRIVSMDSRRPWDEIACRRHSKELYDLADLEIPGVYRMHSETTGTYQRGEYRADWRVLSIILDAAKKHRFTPRDIVLIRPDLPIPADLIEQFRGVFNAS